MPIVKIRQRGQLTIPSEYRKDLHLEESDALNIIKVDDVLILTPKRLVGDRVSREFEKGMKKRGLALQELLGDLKKQRAKYSKEVYETKTKA